MNSLSALVRKSLRFVKDLRRIAVSDQKGLGGREQVIPRQVFQTAESRRVSRDLEKSIQAFRSLNSDLSFQFFDRTARDEYMALHWSGHDIHFVYQRALWGQLQADIFKYCVLWDQGGYWVDLGSSINTKISTLHSPQADAVFSYEDSIPTVAPHPRLHEHSIAPLCFVISWAFGVRPHHPLIGNIINAIVEMAPLFESRQSWSPQRAIFALSGKGMLTRETRQFLMTATGTKLEEVPANWGGFGVPKLKGSSSLIRSGTRYGSLRNVDVFARDLTERTATTVADLKRTIPAPRATPIEAAANQDFEDGTLTSLEDLVSPAPFDGRIPAVLYQTAPSRTLDQRHKAEVDRFRALNPDLDHLLFDDGAIDTYMETHWGHHPIHHVYQRSKIGQMKADIFRYCVLFQNGGFYIDINKAVWKPLTSYISRDTAAIISFERQNSLILPSVTPASHIAWPEKTLIQWCFGFAPQHPVLELAINRIVDLEPLFRGRTFGSTLEAVVAFTGPGVLTWALQQHVAEAKDDTIIQVAPDFDSHAQTRLARSDVAFGGTPHYGKRGGIVILASA